MRQVLLLILLIFNGPFAWANPAALNWDKNQAVEIADSEGVRMLWWNVHAGSLHEHGSPEVFQNNLSNLVHSKFAPDVMAFAEYSPSALGENLLSEFQSTYPYHQDFAYPEQPGEGVTVFSKIPYSISSVDALGTRDLIILNLHANGKEIIFAPVHIRDSWRDFRAENNVMKTIEQILIGSENPVWEQVVAFRSTLESRLGQRLTEKNFVMMGDLNSMKPSRAYDKMGWDLHDPILGFSPTFPASGSDDQKQFPVQIQIDHAFVSPGTQVESAQVLPLLGSDHYALYLIINP